MEGMLLIGNTSEVVYPPSKRLSIIGLQWWPFTRTYEQHNYYRYIISLSNFFYWLLYGLPFVHPGRVMIIITNTIGISFSLWYIAFFLWKCNQRKRVNLLFVDKYILTEFFY